MGEPWFFGDKGSVAEQVNHVASCGHHRRPDEVRAVAPVRVFFRAHHRTAPRQAERQERVHPLPERLTGRGLLPRQMNPVRPAPGPPAQEVTQLTVPDVGGSEAFGERRLVELGRKT